MAASALRGEQNPRGFRLWRVAGFDCATDVLARPEFLSDRRYACEDFTSGMQDRLRQRLGSHMLMLDGPDHARHRRLVTRDLSAQQIAARREQIQEAADRLVTDMRGNGRGELMEDFAYPFALTVLCQMVGIPDSYRLRYQRRRLFTAGLTIMKPGSPECLAANARLHELHALLKEVVAHKRSHPADDLITRLVDAEHPGGRLSRDELTSMLFQILVGGSEPVARFIGGAVVALLDHPEQLAELRAEPDRVANAMEELLRFVTPTWTAAPRFTACPITVQGEDVRPGHPITVVLGEVNRDPARFHDPDRLDLDRDEGAHLAFGHGPHYCAGAHLARLECEIAVSTLLVNLPGLALAVPRDQLDFQPRQPIFRGPAALPVTW